MDRVISIYPGGKRDFHRDRSITKEDVYNFIKDYYNEYEISPSLRDIQNKLNISLDKVSKFLFELEEDKLIKRHKGITRGIILRGENNGKKE